MIMNLGHENETLEFKESLGQLYKGLKSITAMLNRSGYGCVCFGVLDNGDVKGLTVGPNTLMDIRNKIKFLISPQAMVHIEKVTVGKLDYIKVTAHGSDIPYSCDGRYYIRNVAADETVSNEILRKMLTTSETDIIRRIPSEDQDLTFNQFDSFMSKYGIHTESSISFHKNYGLKNDEGKFNLMAYLLSDQNNVSIKVVKFEGTDKSTMSERTDFGSQCLLRSVQEVLEYVKVNNAVKVDLSGGIRKETPLLDYEAFREAWINACLHNSWSEMLPPSVFVYDDRMEIVSYGGLPFGLSKEGFFKGTSLPVNRGLLTIFIATGFAEQSGHGVPIIVSKYSEEAFSFENGMIKVTLNFNYEPAEVVRRIEIEKTEDNLTVKQREVLELIKENVKITQKELSEKANLSLAGVKKIMLKLQNMNLIERVGAKKNGYWTVNSRL